MLRAILRQTWMTFGLGALGASLLGVDRAIAAPDFEKEIRPIFAEHCYQCHGPEKQKSGLRLDDRKSAFQGGDSGVVILPGNARQSRLFQLVAGLDEKLVMPAKGERLTSNQVELLQKWVD